DGSVGTLAITGTTSLTAGTANNITLDNANDFGGDVTIVSGKDVTLNDTGAISFGTAAVTGNLVVTAGSTISFGAAATVGGNLTPLTTLFRSDGSVGTLAITGTTSLTAGTANNITLDNANDFGGDV